MDPKRIPFVTAAALATLAVLLAYGAAAAPQQTPYATMTAGIYAPDAVMSAAVTGFGPVAYRTEFNRTPPNWNEELLVGTKTLEIGKAAGGMPRFQIEECNRTYTIFAAMIPKGGMFELVPILPAAAYRSLPLTDEMALLNKFWSVDMTPYWKTASAAATAHAFAGTAGPGTFIQSVRPGTGVSAVLQEGTQSFQQLGSELLDALIGARAGDAASPLKPDEVERLRFLFSTGRPVAVGTTTTAGAVGGLWGTFPAAPTFEVVDVPGPNPNKYTVSLRKTADGGAAIKVVLAP